MPTPTPFVIFALIFSLLTQAWPASVSNALALSSTLQNTSALTATSTETLAETVRPTPLTETAAVTATAQTLPAQPANVSSAPVTLAESPAFANANVRFRHINTEQGLVNSRILSLMQDRQGFVWIGTAEGLDRFDGQDFVHFQNDPEDPKSLSNNVVWSIYQDRDGYIWVGTTGGLNRFDPLTESFTRYQHDPANPNSLSDDTVNAIYEDRNGVLWIGTGQGGLGRFDRTSQTFIHYENIADNPSSLSNNDVTNIGEDRTGRLWIGTYGGGLNLLEPSQNANGPPTFRRFHADPQSPHGLSHDDIEEMHFDDQGILWIGTWGGGLDRFDPTTLTFTQYRNDPTNPNSISSNTISALGEDSRGNIWVGTWDGGLNRFDRATQSFVHFRKDNSDPDSLSHDSVRSLYITRDDILFAGTAGGGLNLLDLKPNPFHYLMNEAGKSNTLGQNDVRSVLQDRSGILWLGTNSAGLDAYDPRSGRFTHYRHDPADPASLSNNTVWALLEDGDGNLWVGTYGGLDKLDRQSGHFTHYQNDPNNLHSISSNQIMVLYQDRSGSIWVGTYDGLNRFDSKTGTFTSYQYNPEDASSLSNNSIGALYDDGSGYLWVGTQAGLNRLDLQTGKFIRYVNKANDPTSLSNNSVRYIMGDASGYLWLGTYGGLNRFDPKSGQSIHYTTKNGLSSNLVWGILPDDKGNLWLNTTNGINRINTRTGEIRAFNASDGLNESSFNARAVAKSNSGEFLFGSGNGLVLFLPDQVGGIISTPPLVFTDFELANRPVPIGGDSPLQQSIDKAPTLNLSYTDRVLSFAFTAIEYRVPDNIRYRYVLHGFETRWIEVTNKRRFVTYTNLEPGTYSFQVQNTDSNGQWIMPGRSISLVVVPPWWQTIWFRLAVGGVLLLVVAGAYGFRIRVLQQINHDLEDQVSRRTTSLRVMNTELEQRIVEISTMNQIGRVLSRAISIEAMTEEIIAIVTALFRCAGTAICLPSTDQQQMNITDYHQISPSSSTGASASIPSGATTKSDLFQLATASLSMAQVLPILNIFQNGKSIIVNGTVESWPFSAIWPAVHPTIHPQAMVVPIIVRGKINGAMAMVRPSDEGFSGSEITLAETIAIQLAAAYENSYLFSEEHRQRDVAESRSNELSALLTISQDVSSIFELEPLLNRIIYHLGEVIEFSSLLLLELTGDELGVLAQHGIVPAPLTADEEFSAAWLQEETLLFAGHQPLIWADLGKDLAAREGIFSTFGKKLELLLKETRSCMIVPMVSRDTITGIFWLGHKQPGCFSESQADYVTAVAHQTAIAIENAHQLEAMQVAAADRERNRLAQELHDSVSQSLLAANKAAESLPAVWAKSPEQGKYVVGLLQRMMQNALAEMRTLMLELRPAMLGQKPLSEILRQLSDSFAGRSQLPVDLQLHGDAILPAICQVTFYRIAQSAFDNIQQHANASQVTVVLNCTPQFVELWIADNGVGFDSAKVPPDRMGVNIMRERAEKIGATFQMESQPGHGVQITLHYDRHDRPKG